MSIAPPPVFKSTSSIANLDDIRIVLGKLGQKKVVDLFSNMGIAIRGGENEIYDICAHITSWDYKKTKQLRDIYALSDESGVRLTGFLIEVSPNMSSGGLQNFLRNNVTSKLRSSNNQDDLLGFIEATPQENDWLLCTYRYRRARIKSSDLSVFQDVPVDTPIWVYDTHLKTKSGKSLYCVAMQPASTLEYTKVRQEFVELFKNNPLFHIHAFALKIPQLNNDDYNCLGFKNCADSNAFMDSLLQIPVLSDVSIKDLSSIQVFKWDRVVEPLDNTNLGESQSIEDDLHHHLKDLKIDGVSLQKAKTITAAFEADKHAASTMSICYESLSRKIFFDTEIKFRVQNNGLEIKVAKIWQQTALGRAETIYDMNEYMIILWNYWHGILHRYVEAVDL